MFVLLWPPASADITELRAGKGKDVCAVVQVAADVIGVIPPSALPPPSLAGPASGRQSQLPAAPGPPGALQPATAMMIAAAATARGRAARISARWRCRRTPGR